MGRRFGGSLWVLSAQEKEAAMDAIEVALKMLTSGKFRWGGGEEEKSFFKKKTRWTESGKLAGRVGGKLAFWQLSIRLMQIYTKNIYRYIRKYLYIHISLIIYDA